MSLAHDQKTYGARRMRAELATPDTKRVPADRDLESAFLADLLHPEYGADAIASVRDYVTHKDFTVGTYALIYAAVLDIADMHTEQGRGELTPSRTEVLHWIRAKREMGEIDVYLTEDEEKAIDDLGGSELIRAFESIINSRSLAMRVEQRAQRIRELSFYRRTVERLWTTAGVGCSGDPALFRDSLAELATLIQDGMQAAKPESEHISEPLKRVIAKYLKPDRKHETFVSTGNAHLDEVLELERGDLVIVGARSGRGKSVLALGIAKHVGMHLGPALVFTGEMNSEQMSLRALCSDARVDSHSVKRARIGRDDWGKLNDAGGRLNRSRIFMSDLSGIDVLRLCGIARREAKRIKQVTGEPLRLIVVDYLQRVRPGRAAPLGANREQQVAAVAFQLKELAMELGVVIVSPCQLNAEADDRDDGRPLVSDLRESKGIENEADAIVLIHNPKYHERARRIANGQPLEDEPCELTVGKSRNGKLGTAYAWFEPPFTSFKPMSADEVEFLESQRKRDATKQPRRGAA